MRQRLWLCLPPLLVCLGDQVATFWNQPSDYWAGHYWATWEQSPHGAWLMTRHPLAYLGAALGYMLLFTVVILLLPRRLALVGAIALVLGHTWGMGVCLWDPLEQWRYWPLLGMFLAIAVLTVLCMEWSDPDTSGEPRAAPKEPSGERMTKAGEGTS
jgi:hypothetical protein